eukprot:maker-scaffold9_size846264-snap-gene-7.26 protein:Tk08411 transcript:maker-scaffold9_size846264-snap-gene-7.26-mRNA-1 annotation:"PREDICTED: acetylcholinesterase-like"
MRSTMVWFRASLLLAWVGFSHGIESIQGQFLETESGGSLEDEGFKTSAHHGYRAYYVLGQKGTGNRGYTQTRTNYSPQQNSRPSTNNHGVWYPKEQPNVQTSQPIPSQGTPHTFNANSGNLAERLRAYGFNKLVGFIEQAGLVSAISQADQSFTVFAPSDEAFESFLASQPQTVIDTFMEEPDVLKELILHHLVPGRLMVEDLKDKQKLVNLRDQMLQVLFSSEGKLISGSPLMTAERRVNIQTGNGVIHGVSEVIYPFKSNDEMKLKTKRVLDLNDDDPELIKKTQEGSIKGVNLSPQVRAWLGVPFAQAPVGDLRFAPPVDAEPSSEDDVLNTRRQPKSCMQNLDTTGYSGADLWNTQEELSEDCLYLNIYAPKNATKALPVFVWIHGGGHSTGSASLDRYDGSQIVSGGEVVFVAIQYRLGVLGFMFLGEGTNIPGNMGFLDQVKALQWIQNNIGTFGGNPEDVTLVGESSGANSAAMHMISPKSEGLFHKVILQSSALNAPWAYAEPEEARERARNLSQLLDCPSDPDEIVGCLREKDAKDLVAKEFDGAPSAINSYPFGPTLDGDFITESPEKALTSGLISSKIPVLLGSNANEGFYSLMYFDPDTFPDQELDEDDQDLSEKDFNDVVQAIFPQFPFFVRELIKHEYRDLIRSGGKGRFKALDRMAGDFAFVCDVEGFAQDLSENGNQVYRYHFDHRSSQDPWPEYTGSKHGDEIEFMFGVPLETPELYMAKEVGLAEDMVTYWLNFVKAGNPNPSVFLESWPRYQEPDWSYLNLTTAYNGGRAEKGTLSQRCKFWNELLNSLMKALGVAKDVVSTVVDEVDSIVDEVEFI